ncbi:MAG: hypothetical protein ACRDRH_27400 [Pseudonocardia sp.]
MTRRITTITQFGPELSERVLQVTGRAAALPQVRSAVETNHDDNRWWPAGITDPRMRMLAAGWSTRVSYTMIGSYARVIARADSLGFNRLASASDEDITDWARPIGLFATRITYLRSLAEFLNRLDTDGIDVLSGDADEMINRFASDVAQASFKVAQCAVLYSRGYHCGVLPVDSGMVTKLAPVLGIDLPSGPIAHEQMRHLLQDCVTDRAEDYRRLAATHAVTIPAQTAPTWWAHLVLIYFKRQFLNRPSPRLCPRRPICDQVLDCPHSKT